MKKHLFLLVPALFLALPSAWAIPDSFGGGGFFGPIIPAFPRFNANLTEDFLEVGNWDKQELPGPWQDLPALGDQEVRQMTAMPVLFGAVPMNVRAYEDEGELKRISITYLDAGTYFGYNPGGEDSHEERRVGAEKRTAFAHYYNQLTRDLRQRLEEGCGRGQLTSVGRSDLLRTAFQDFEWGGFILRFAARPGHSVQLQILRERPQSNTFLDPELADMSEREREEFLAQNVSSNERGDLILEDIPMYRQGNTPFCGVHSLAMVGNYYGLRMDADSLAAGGKFRNTGSAQGSRVFDLYYATAEEVGMRATVSPRFDFDRVKESLEEGRPVIVWRRVTMEREQAHREFAAELAENPDSHLAEPTPAERQSWPARDRRGSPSHASIISGFNAEHSELIITEPWGEYARGRRIHADELEASVYATFYFKF